MRLWEEENKYSVTVHLTNLNLTIPSRFFVGWVKRQRNPKNALGFVPQPNLRIQAFFNFAKVLI